MAQSKLQKTVAAAALGGLTLGAAAYISGCQNTEQAGTQVSTPSVAHHDCKGMNDCKGKGGCKGAGQACKGQNSCKGKGGCKS